MTTPSGLRQGDVIAAVRELLDDPDDRFVHVNHDEDWSPDCGRCWTNTLRAIVGDGVVAKQGFDQEVTEV